MPVVFFSERRDHVHHVEVAANLFTDPRTQQLDDNLGAILQRGRMHLRDRCRRERFMVESGKDLVDRFAVNFVEPLDRDFGREWRYAVLKLGKLIGNVDRKQVTPGRDCLAEFYEYRTELDERLANANAERCVVIGPLGKQRKQESQRPQQVRCLDEFVQPVTNQRALNRKHANDGSWLLHDCPALRCSSR